MLSCLRQRSRPFRGKIEREFGIPIVVRRPSLSNMSSMRILCIVASMTALLGAFKVGKSFISIPTFLHTLTNGAMSALSTRTTKLPLDLLFRGHDHMLSRCNSACSTTLLDQVTYRHSLYAVDILSGPQVRRAYSEGCHLRVGRNTSMWSGPLHYTLVPLPGHVHIPTPAT